MTAARPHVQSVAKFVRVSPRKARLVADHIRGRSVPEARTILAFTQRAAAREIEKVLRSAILAVRFGSYSMCATLAGTPSLSLRRKSISR